MTNNKCHLRILFILLFTFSWKLSTNGAVLPWRHCKLSQFTCSDNRCLDAEGICDGQRDCLYGEDEIDCDKQNSHVIEVKLSDEGATTESTFTDTIVDRKPSLLETKDTSFKLMDQEI